MCENISSKEILCISILFTFYDHYREINEAIYVTNGSYRVLLVKIAASLLEIIKFSSRPFLISKKSSVRRNLRRTAC